MSEPPEWPGDRGGHVWPKDREVVAGDGARIRYTVRGPEGAPWMVLCAGYMCPDNFWTYVGPRWMEHHRVIVVNYRGIGASTDPRPPGYRALRVSADDYTIERFAGDVAAVLEAEDATEVAVVGHSMGVQVALQLWRTAPARVATLSLVTGPYASPLHTFYGSKLGIYLFPLAVVGLTLSPRIVQRLVGLTLQSPVAMPLARLIRALGPHTPDEAMQPYFDHFDEVDPMVALKIARGMHRFDAGPWLEEVDVPVQVVVGSEDRFSPPALGEVMVSRLPDAELVTVPGGTHGAIIEEPDQVAEAVLEFLDRRRRTSPTPGASSRPRPGARGRRGS